MSEQVAARARPGDRTDPTDGERVLYAGATELHLRADGSTWAQRHYTSGDLTVAVRSNESGSNELNYLVTEPHGTASLAVDATDQAFSRRCMTPSGAPRGSTTGTAWPYDKGFLCAVLSAGVDDGHLARNPCSAASVRPPAVSSARVVPWLPSQVRAVRDALPKRYQAMVAVGSGCGLRQGEIIGLSEDAVQLDGDTLRVSTQVKLIRGVAVFAPRPRATRSGTYRCRPRWPLPCGGT